MKQYHEDTLLLAFSAIGAICVFLYILNYKG